MLPHAARWTAEMVRVPDDGNRYEVVDGELLVTPVPAELRQRAVTLPAFELGLYARARGGFEALVSPADLEPDPEGRCDRTSARRGSRLGGRWWRGTPVRRSCWPSRCCPLLVPTFRRLNSPTGADRGATAGSPRYSDRRGRDWTRRPPRPLALRPERQHVLSHNDRGPLPVRTCRPLTMRLS